MRAQDPLLVENAVLARLVADQAAGREPSTAEYREAFPGHEELVGRLLREWHEPNDEAVERYGPFEVVSVLGRGGQGIVYLARDVELPRTVALKVLGAGSFDTERQLRFRREAEVAARLDHPNICRVLAYGIENGSPYLAMQFVPGESLARVIAAKVGDGAVALTAARSSSENARVTAVLSMVEKLARALHVAHEDGVVHRDVKPANVMLTPNGEPVLLDFGLAHDDDCTTETLTMTADVLGTPAYMAPEQVAGQRADRRTDVFALGVVLYECLTGSRPFAGTTRQELFDAICSGQFSPPGKITGSLPSDVDLVLAVALDIDPNRRYETAEALADDLARVLAKEPVTARPVGAVVRIQRFLQRNRTLAISTALILGVSISATVMTATALLRSEDSRAEAQSINEYILKDLLLAAGPRALGRDARIVDTLQQGAERIEQRFADRPALASTLRLHLARTFGGLGQWREAQELAQKSFDTRRDLFGALDERSLEAEYEVAYAKRRLHDFAEAARMFAGHRDRCLQVHGGNSEQALRAEVQLASAQALRDSFRDGLDALRNAYERCQRQLGSMATTTRMARSSMAELSGQAGDDQGALAYARETYELNVEHFGSDSLEAIEGRLDYAMSLVDIRELDAAIEHLTEVLPQIEKRYGPAHPHVATTHDSLASAYNDSRQTDKALEHHGKAVDIASAAFGKDHDFTMVMRSNLAIAFRSAGRFDESIEQARNILSVRRRVLGEKHILVARAYDLLTAVYISKREIESAIEYGEKALATAEAAIGKDDVRLGDFVWALARANEIAERYEPALHLWQRALRFDEQAGGPESRWVATDLYRIGFSQHWLRRFQEARDSFDRAIRIHESKQPKNEVNLARLRALRAASAFRLGETEGVVDVIETAWQFLETEGQLQVLYYSDVVAVHILACQQAGNEAILARARARMDAHPEWFGKGFPE